ncbi:hypothetical protein FQR65_LT12409 [Abscondita terminalis]|nr:hypothetical protein FQR65_LT12409 [Abscondita terminalis]
MRAPNEEEAERNFVRELMVEEELTRARRQKIVLEKKINALKAGGKVQKLQTRLIGCIFKEHYDVLNDLVTAAGPTQQKANVKLTKDLNTLLSENDELNAVIRKKRSYQDEVGNEIDKVKKNILEIKKKTISDNQYAQRLVYSHQTLKGLENKLELVTKTYCTIMTDSRVLRDEIRVMMSERMAFNKLWFKYIANLSRGKQILIDIIEQATIAYNDRDEWVQRLTALREMAYSDFRNQRQEYLNQQRVVDRDYQLATFMATKSNKRIMTQLEEKKDLKQKQIIEKMTDTLDHNKKILEKIKKFKKMDVEADQEGFVYAYCLAEETNMTHFHCITDMYRDMDEVTTSIMAYQLKIESEQELAKERKRQQWIKNKSLKIRLKAVNAEGSRAEDKMNETESILEMLYDGIKKLIKITKCDLSQFQHLLGSNHEINKYNVMLFYALLEGRVDDLILNVCRKERYDVLHKKSFKKHIINRDLYPEKLYRVDEIVETSPCPLCVERDLVRNVVDSLQFVQTKEQVKAHLEEQLKLPDASEKLHNVSACTLPSSRAIIQKRCQ